jgi:hypothetical protein
MSSECLLDSQIAHDLANNVRGLGDILARHTLPAGTTFEEARGWAEAYMWDHFGTAVAMHFEKDASVCMTVFEVLVPNLSRLPATMSVAEGVESIGPVRGEE